MQIVDKNPATCSNQRVAMLMREANQYVTRSDKTGLIALFCILKNTDLKY